MDGGKKLFDWSLLVFFAAVLQLFCSFANLRIFLEGVVYVHAFCFWIVKFLFIAFVFVRCASLMCFFFPMRRFQNGRVCLLFFHNRAQGVAGKYRPANQPIRARDFTGSSSRHMINGRYVVGMWLICGRYVVGMVSVCGQFVVGMWSINAVVTWSVKATAHSKSRVVI